MALELWLVVQDSGSFGNCHLAVEGNKYLIVFVPNVRGDQTAVLGVQQILNSLDIQGVAEASAHLSTKTEPERLPSATDAYDGPEANGPEKDGPAKPDGWAFWRLKT
jgi:hypothetical protein